MAENTNYYYYTKNQANSDNNPSKFYSHFLYKALIVTIFLVILPVFPSQPPEFINQTLNTRGWEFLHLIFVGIAVSYGLFSRRNDDTEKDNNTTNNSKFDNAQSYVSRFLQVSSVFDDDADTTPSRSDGGSSNSVQTWNNQYYRNEPVVVVAEEQQHSVLDQEQRKTIPRIDEKPLLLPVRSLKSSVLDADGDGTCKDSSSCVSASISRSNSNLGSKRFSSNSFKIRNAEFGGSHHQDLEEKIKDNVVLPSPIPWRSRSGRMEMKETREETGSPLHNLSPSIEESEFNKSFRGQVSRSPRPDSTTSSPKLSPSPSFSAETQGKSAEDFVRKKSFYRSPPPPPPPPPLPQVLRRARSMKPSFSEIGSRDYVEKDMKRSFTIEPKEMNRIGSLSMPKSARTTRSNDSFGMARKEKEFDDVVSYSKAEKGFDQAAEFKIKKLNHDRVTFMPQPTYMEFPQEEEKEFVEKLVMESDEDLEETEDDFDAAVTADDDDDDDDHEDETAGRSSFVSSTSRSSNNEETSSGNASDGGPDVDKKADEFIAKFREQIRLQRIESIKKSSGQINRKASR